MIPNSTRIKTKPTENSCAKERFVVFVAGGKHPVIRFENFSRAESLAVSFAGLLNMRMEVFDSVKETCYFIEPAEAKG
jgi:predicted P-loop ATPase/GTPase